MLNRYKVYYQDGLFERELPFAGVTKESAARTAKEYLEFYGYEYLRIEEIKPIKAEELRQREEFFTDGE